MAELTLVWMLIASLIIHVPFTDRQLVSKMHERDIPARVSKDGVYVFLPMTYFATNVHELTLEQKAKLEGVAEVLKLNGVKRRYIYIEGHTDSMGTDFYNQRLSLMRARAVEMELIRLDIGADRMDSVGYGSKHPISTNFADNRRVQLLIYSK